MITKRDMYTIVHRSLKGVVTAIFQGWEHEIFENDRCVIVKRIVKNDRATMKINDRWKR